MRPTPEVGDDLERTIELARRGLPPDDWMLGVMLSALGSLLLELERCDAALPILQEWVQILRAALGEEHPFTARYDGLLMPSGPASGPASAPD